MQCDRLVMVLPGSLSSFRLRTTLLYILTLLTHHCNHGCLYISPLTQPVILLHKHLAAFDIYTYSLFPRHSSPVVLQAAVGGREDLGMRLLLCEMYASGKRYCYETL